MVAMSRHAIAATEDKAAGFPEALPLAICLQVPDTRLCLSSTDQMQRESGPFSGPFCCRPGAFPSGQSPSAKRQKGRHGLIQSPFT
jgi:hypothetical protein